MNEINDYIYILLILEKRYFRKKALVNTFKVPGFKLLFQAMD